MTRARQHQIIRSRNQEDKGEGGKGKTIKSRAATGTQINREGTERMRQRNTTFFGDLHLLLGPARSFSGFTSTS